jgi:xyloglucan:xyloglucosyl transferase
MHIYIISLIDRWFRGISGAGFISSKMYKYGFFSANIKLPGDYTAGLCVAFYVSDK